MSIIEQRGTGREKKYVFKVRADMLSTKELLDQVVSSPIEEQANFADSILKSLNNPSDEIDSKWIELAKRRLDELLSGKVQAIPGHEVFNKVKEQFAK